MEMINGNDSIENKFVKRRRRDPSSVALTGNAKQSEPKPSESHQTSTPTATTVKRSSKYRGVSRHRWTGRYEAHLWDKGTWNPTQRKKGKQVYLGAYDEEESAARAYDLAALKYWGASTFTNFPVSDYAKELEVMQTMTKEEYLASLRRRSSGFSRGVSKYRGVARHHHNGRWEARIGRVFGNKYLYLGTYRTQEEAAHAYDIAAIEYRGINAVTNFDLSTYIRWLKPPTESNHHTSLPSLKESKPTDTTTMNHLRTTLPPIPTFSAVRNLTNDQKPTTRQFNFLHSNNSNNNPFMTNCLNTQNDHDNSFNRNSGAPISPMYTNSSLPSSSSSTSSCSPSALGLLLKSSVFKELVEKNLITNIDYEQNEEINDVKDFTQIAYTNNSKNDNATREIIDEDIFYTGIDNDFSYNICPPSVTGNTMLSGLASKEENNVMHWFNKVDW